MSEASSVFATGPQLLVSPPQLHLMSSGIRFSKEDLIPKRWETAALYHPHSQDPAPDSEASATGMGQTVPGLHERMPSLGKGHWDIPPGDEGR